MGRLKFQEWINMSKRAEAANKIVNYLTSELNKFNAPYGVLSSEIPIGKGKIRQITFGIARYLDATINIYSEKRFKIQGRGALASKYNGDFESVEQVIEHLSK